MSKIKNTQEIITETCDKVKEFLLEKNRNYGDSAINPCRIFSSASIEEQINVRIDDKINRMMKGDISIQEDTELDLIGYLILKRVFRVMQKNEKVEMSKVSGWGKCKVSATVDTQMV